MATTPQISQLKASSALSSAPMMRPRPVVQRQPVLYTGPAVPSTYDPNWRKYTNLNDPPYRGVTQAAFMAMPETCTQVARDLRHSKVLGAIPKITPEMTVAQVQDALDAAKAAVAAPFATEAAVVDNIGKTVHTQADVQAAFAPPTSNPAPTPAPEAP